MMMVENAICMHVITYAKSCHMQKPSLPPIQHLHTGKHQNATFFIQFARKNERLQIINSKVINCMKCIEKWTKLCSNLLWDISFSLLNGLVDACINKCCWCSISLEEKCSRCDESCARCCCCWYIIHKLSILLGCQDAIEGGCQHVTPLSLDDTMLQSSFSWYMQSMFGQKTNDRQE